MISQYEKLLCACCSKVPLVELMQQPTRLYFRKRVKGEYHFLVIVLPEGTELDMIERVG